MLNLPTACRPGNYLLQLEVVHLLLVLCSTQLFTPSARSALGAHPFVDAIMQVGDRRAVGRESWDSVAWIPGPGMMHVRSSG